MRLTQSLRELSSSAPRVRCAELTGIWLNPIMSNKWQLGLSSSFWESALFLVCSHPGIFTVGCRFGAAAHPARGSAQWRGEKSAFIMPLPSQSVRRA